MTQTVRQTGTTAETAQFRNQHASDTEISRLPTGAQ
jgi:hypothetical protein